jgi:hypothetical protein
MQGYLLTRPVPAEKLLPLIAALPQPHGVAPSDLLLNGAHTTGEVPSGEWIVTHLRAHKGKS